MATLTREPAASAPPQAAAKVETPTAKTTPADPKDTGTDVRATVVEAWHRLTGNDVHWGWVLVNGAVDFVLGGNDLARVAGLGTVGDRPVRGDQPVVPRIQLDRSGPHAPGPAARCDGLR